MSNSWWPVPVCGGQRFVRNYRHSIYGVDSVAMMEILECGSFHRSLNTWVDVDVSTHYLYRYNMYERNWIYASSLDLNNWSGRLPNSQRVSRDQDLSGVGVEVHCMCTFHSVSHCSSYRCCTEIDQQLLAFKNSFNPTALYWLINNICSFERELKTPIEIEKWPVTMSRGARARRTP